MAVYKVPQDVEADDKLIGPFSFRQFIYLIIVAVSMGLAWLLAQAYIVLAVIPLPVILFFSILALPGRRGQPMEAYLSAVVSFYFLKSRKRLWQPDGIDSFVTIIPPKNSERMLTKGLDESEASRRLDYLAELVDTHGWAIRGAGSVPDNSISKDVYYESQGAEDMFDSKTERAQAMNERLNQKTQERRKEAKTNMQKVTPSPAKATRTAEKPISNQLTAPVPPPKTMSPADATAYAKKLAESASTQKKEIGKKPPVNSAANTSVSTPDTGTMELTRKQAEELSQNNQVSVKTLAEEANRIAKKNKEALLEGEEVTISLR